MSDVVADIGGLRVDLPLFQYLLLQFGGLFVSFSDCCACLYSLNRKYRCNDLVVQDDPRLHHFLLALVRLHSVRNRAVCGVGVGLAVALGGYHC